MAARPRAERLVRLDRAFARSWRRSEERPLPRGPVATEGNAPPDLRRLVGELTEIEAVEEERALREGELSLTELFLRELGNLAADRPSQLS